LATRYSLGEEPAECVDAGIEEAIAHELHQITELLLGESNRVPQNRVDLGSENIFEGSEMEIRRHSVGARVVVPQRGFNVEMK
jgi:hypothetical protein